MNYRNGNYSAFYVAEPFSTSNLGAYATKDFCYYNTLKAWAAADSSFNFIDSHDKTYSVRDDSSWELTLKPRLHERLNNSKNILLFLSSNTKDSRALHEEILYGIENCNLPIIVIYPDCSQPSDIVDTFGFIRPGIRQLWDKLPVFRDRMNKIATIHIPMNKKLISDALNEEILTVQHMKQGIYHY